MTGILQAVLEWTSILEFLLELTSILEVVLEWTSILEVALELFVFEVIIAAFVGWLSQNAGMLLPRLCGKPLPSGVAVILDY